MSVGVSWKLVFKSSDMYIIVDGAAGNSTLRYLYFSQLFEWKFSK